MTREAHIRRALRLISQPRDLGAIEPVKRGFDWPGFLIIGIPVLLAVFL
jgi:hypothetical protein